MDKQPLISVIVPIYRIDKYIGLCIDSITHQTYRNLEIILVDDGSDDRSGELCDLYAKKDSRIKVIHKQNGGLVSARKAGVLAATGEYIGYVDGDDWIGEGFYQSLYAAAVSSGADITVAGFSRDLFSKKHGILNNIASGIYEGETLDKLRSRMISYGEFYRHGVTTYVWNKLFRRECVIKEQLEVDERITIGEDAAVVYPAILNAKSVCITDNCAYHYRQREDSMLKRSGDFKAEAAKLKVLYEYMQSACKDRLDQYGLKRQIDDFITATYIIRSGGYTDALTEFPYPRSIEGKKIVLYGAGTFGQQMKSRMDTLGFCEVVGWVDSDYREYRRCCMDVDDIRAVTNMEYDYIVAATLDIVYAEEIKRTLLDYGVEPERILFVSSSKNQRDKALQYYLSI